MVPVNLARIADAELRQFSPSSRSSDGKPDELVRSGSPLSVLRGPVVRPRPVPIMNTSITLQVEVANVFLGNCSADRFTVNPALPERLLNQSRKDWDRCHDLVSWSLTVVATTNRR
jgi:hypothetical protein